MIDLEAADPLTAADLSHFQRTGWAVARGYFTPQETAAISAWTDEILGWPEVPGRHMVYGETSMLDPDRRIVQRIERFCPFHPGFDELVRRGRLIRSVERLLGAPAVLFKEKINFKLAGGAGFEPHQDQQAGWSAYAPEFLTALVCIDRATMANGCLEMADCPRHSGLVGEEWRPLLPEQMSSFRLIPVETDPGDVVFFDSYAPHASAPNLTSEPRRILYLTYNRAADGDHRERYFDEKRRSFPPDVEREPGRSYKFRV